MRVTVLRALTLSLLALLTAAGSARAQMLQEREEPEPFLVPRSGNVWPDRFEEWARAVTAHEPGKVDGAWLAVSSYTVSELGGILRGFERGLVPVPVSGTPAVLRCGALLHTELAMAAMTRSEQADAASDAAGSVQFGVALKLVTELRIRASADPFVHSWYLATGAFLVSHRELSATPIFLKRALSLFPGDAQLLMMAGAVYELRASPRVQEATDLGGARARFGGAGTNLGEAERYYRRALKADPTLVEAQVRLARVLGSRGHPEEAVPQLEAATRTMEAGRPVESAVRYLLSLVRGQEEAALDHDEKARAAFQRALALYPGADSACLALSRLEHRAGARAAAAAAIANMVQRPEAARPDPWRDYFSAGQARRAPDLLAELGRMAQAPR